MSTNTALDQIKARVEGHTEGPWAAVGGEWGTTNKRLTMLWAGQRDDNDYMVATAFAESKADAELIAAAPKLLAALEAVEALAEEWRYKGEFGWGAWQEGHGPGPDGQVLDSAAGEIRQAIEEALR